MQHRVIEVSSTLHDLERELSDVTANYSSTKLALHVPRSSGAYFFKESRLALFLLSVSKHFPDLLIRDYAPVWPSDVLPAYFRRSLVGITSCFLVDSLQSARGDPVPREAARNAFRELIRDRKGVLERNILSDPDDKSFEGRSITICCFDPSNPEPWELKGLMAKPDLFEEVLFALRHELEKGSGPLNGRASPRGANRTLMRFLTELYENGYEHGRFDEDGQILYGMRFIQMKKHIGKKNALISRASGFAELARYVEATASKTREDRFYEINVSDSGLGILDGFLARIPGGQQNYIGHEDARETLQRLLFTSLSRKVDVRGAGLGLPNALRAAQALSGFVSLRTARYWLYRSFGPDALGDTSFDRMYDVEGTASLAAVPGAQFNMLFPLPVVPTG